MSEAQGAPLLQIRHLSKTYKGDKVADNDVIRDMTLDIAARDFLCIMGPSGCGKSTLMRCVAGFEAFEGDILLDGKAIREPSMERIMVFQDFNQLFPWKTIRKNVEYPLKLSGIKDKAERRRRAVEMLEKVGLGGYTEHYPHQLSGGMKQRAAIARALVMRPRIILMDEPFASLDAITRRSLQNELIKVTTGEDITVLFVTHNIQEALILGSRVLILSAQGGVVVDEPNRLEKPVKPSSPGYAEVWDRYSAALQG